MMFYLNLISIAFAVSLDGFGVGMTYGMRKITLTLPALFIVMLCSGAIVLSSMTIGHFIRLIVTPSFTSVFGSVILILLGLFVFSSNLKTTFDWKIFENKSKGKFYHMTALLSNPDQADKDQSGVISSGEALVLGIALAMDAFGAGFAAAMLGYSPFITAILIAMMSGIFLFSGMKLGFLLTKWKAMEKVTFLPPLLLIGIGVFNLIS